MVTVRRGDVYWTRFDPVEGCEQAGTRPAVIIQNDMGNRYSPNTIVAPVTTRRSSRPYPFVVPLPRGTLQRDSSADLAQIRTIHQGRLIGSPLAHLNADTMHKIDDAIRASLGLY